MRKLFTLLCILITISSNAQLKKGDWNINTSTNAPMNLRFRKTNDVYSGTYKSLDLGINPGVGYFIADRWEIGGGPAVSIYQTKFISPGPNSMLSKSNASSIGLNLFTRYYLKKEGRLRPYLIVSGGYAKLHNKYTSVDGSETRYSSHEWRASAGAGLSWFIAPNVALFSELTYTNVWGNGGGYPSGLDFKIGFQVFLNRKKAKLQ